MAAFLAGPTECPHEAEVITAVHGGHWPPADGTTLAAHLAACDVCRDVADVACSFDAERRTATRTASVPSAGRVWWRAQMRARMEAAELASQPFSIAQGIGVASAVALALLSVRWAWWSTPVVGGWLGGIAGDASAMLSAGESGIVQLGLWLTLGLAALVLVPVVVLYALPDD